MSSDLTAKNYKLCIHRLSVNVLASHWITVVVTVNYFMLILYLA